MFQPHKAFCRCLLAVVLTAVFNMASLHAEEVKEDWIRGTAKNLQMRIAGEVIDFDGLPSKDPTISAVLRDNNFVEPIDVKTNGHRFEVWLPVHRADWHSVRFQVSSKDGKRRSSKNLMRPFLRQRAIDGLKFSLQPSTRSFEVKTVHDGAPVAGANVRVTTNDSAILNLRSDQTGTLQVHLLPNETIDRFTAWTDEPLIGGFSLSREPVRDESAAVQTIELHTCRDQVIRVVDGEGNGCADVVMYPQVATPRPNVNYLGRIPESRLTTNKKGEAVFRWFPDWKDVHCYVDLESDRWVIDGDAKWIDGDFVVRVKPRIKRHRATGKLVRADGSKAGFCIFWRGKGEREGRSDFITSTTDQDGNFSADVLPARAYCVFVNDTDNVSDMVDLVPVPMDGSDKQPAIVQLQEPETVEIVVDAGPQKRPLVNQPVYVRQTHDYDAGNAARDRYVYTDKNGKARAVVESGKQVEVTIYSPGWRMSQEIDVVAGEKNSVILHREIDEPRTVLGMVVQDKENPIPVEEIVLVAGSVDGQTRGFEKLSLRKNGVFAYQTRALSVGVYATTTDGSMAGFVVAENPRRLLRLPLTPTKPLRGKLVDQDGKAIANREVHAEIRITHKPKNAKLNSFYGFDVSPGYTVKTNADGEYTFENMPVGTEIAVVADSPDKRRDHWLGLSKLSSDKENEVKESMIKD